MLNKIVNKITKNNILKNVIILFSGQSIASVISLINTVIFIKSVGIYGSGIVAIIQSYSNIFNSLFNFQSYAAIIKYGADSLESDDSIRLKKHIKQAFIQDFITSIFAFLCGLLLVNTASKFMKWDSQVILYIKLYLVTIVFNITGSITGILRLLDRFSVIVKVDIITPIIKCILLVFGLLMKFKLPYYILLEIFINIMSNIILFYYGYIVLKEYKLNDWYNEKISFDKEFTKFNIYNNIVSTLDMPTVQLTNLIINKFLGINELGIYNILTKIGNIFNRIMVPIGQSLLPELSKLVSSNNKDEALRIVKKMFIITNVIGISMMGITIISGKIWVDLFIPYSLSNMISLVLYILYITITGSIIGINQIFVTFNLVKYNVIIVGIVNFVYLVSVYFFTNMYALNGIIICLTMKEIIVGLIKNTMINKYVTQNKYMLINNI